LENVSLLFLVTPVTYVSINLPNKSIHQIPANNVQVGGSTQEMQLITKSACRVTEGGKFHLGQHINNACVLAEREREREREKERVRGAAGAAVYVSIIEARVGINTNDRRVSLFSWCAAARQTQRAPLRIQIRGGGGVSC
jgi:hypothetical protein